MEQKQITATYAEAVKAIKEAILESRYRAARLVNKEVLALYYAIGGYISVQSRAARWGSNAIGTISELLQQELPGLRGFSETSIKRMRIFYEAWCSMFENRPLSADDLQNSIIPVGDKGHIEIRPLATDELPPETLDAFLAVGFTNHYEILAQKKDVEQRLFYIVNCATGFWNGDKLKYYMKDDLFGKRGNMPNNFAKTIANVDLRSKALRSFKDEYLLDFVNIEDPDETDERVIEQQIVHNIKNFIMALGSDFSFMGNQYRLVVSEKEKSNYLIFKISNYQNMKKEYIAPLVTIVKLSNRNMIASSIISTSGVEDLGVGGYTEGVVSEGAAKANNYSVWDEDWSD